MNGPGDVFWAVVVILLLITLALVFTWELRRYLADRRIHRAMRAHLSSDERHAAPIPCLHLDRAGLYTNPTETHLVWACLTCGDSGTDVIA